MNIILGIILSFLLAGNSALAGGPPTHSLIRIHVADESALRAVWDAGIDYEGAAGKPGGWMEFVAAPAEMRALEERGIAFGVVEPDLPAASAKLLFPGPMNALGFGFGSMGGYYTLDELGRQLDSMRLLYPGLISEKVEYGYSIEGRPIWAVRISDNPDVDEPSEPEVLYTALTHAREPAGMMTVVYYMWWLLEHYAVDPEARYLVDNRQIWFIPVVNPDGYEYNRATNPSGGGFWRKNRRDNGNTTFGIDLNRNYGPYDMWNAPNGGSSTSPGGETYRGTDPFSEPETQTIDVFMRLHNIRTCLNYHTYGNLLVYPFGYIEAEGPDSLIYREFAFDLTRVNRYVYGTDQQTVNYSTRGNSDDYMYGDTTKFRTFAMTPEVGPSFWPPSNQILPLAMENLRANIRYSYVAGAMPYLRDVSLPPPADSAGLVPGAGFSLAVSIRNAGLDTARALSLSLSAGPDGLDFSGLPVSIPILAPRSDTTITITGTVDSGALPGSRLPLLARLTDPSGYDRTDTALIYIGAPALLFADDAESGAALWTAGGNWNAVAVGHGGGHSFHDSPAGPSAAWSATGIQTAAPINLRGRSSARLEFWTKWAIEPSYDFATVRVSEDSGASWTTLRASLSNPASGSGVQAPGSFGYDGYTPGPDWVRQEVDLSAFTGRGIILRFELATDGSDSRDGWYVDDVSVTGYRAPVPGGPIGLTSAALGGVDLFFGEWPGAGDGIDEWLGESELAPPPGPGTFDARWEIPGTNGSLTDIRDTLAGADDTNVFTLRLRGGPSEYPVALRWNREDFSPGAWTITDTIAGHTALRADMWMTDEANIADPAVTAVRITHARSGSSSVRIAPRWGLVSLPVTPPDGSVPALFPNAMPHAFSYDGAYVTRDVISPGEGYWLLNDSADTLLLPGVPFDRNQVANPSGKWIIFGSIYCPLPAASICPSCVDQPVVFGYHNGYYIPDTLVPGEAYWYRGSAPLDLDCRKAGPVAGPAHGPKPQERLGSLTFSSADGGSATIRFACGLPGTVIPGRFRLPPAPPAGGFDARFETENAVEYFDESGLPIGIRISPGAGDVRATYRGDPSDDGTFSLEVSSGSGTGVPFPLRDGAVLTVPAGASVRLAPAGAPGLPAAFRVYGNFPNPFNPSTSFSFDLPEVSSVTLRIRNIAGQEVDVPVRDAEMAAGRHLIRYDAGRLASGAYFYTLTASRTGGRPAESSTGKFLLIR